MSADLVRIALLAVILGRAKAGHDETEQVGCPVNYISVPVQYLWLRSSLDRDRMYGSIIGCVINVV